MAVCSQAGGTMVTVTALGFDLWDLDLGLLFPF